MRVAFLVSSFPIVTETFILDQITGLIDLGCEIEIFGSHLETPAAVHPDVEAYGLMARHVSAMPDRCLRRPSAAVALAFSRWRSLGWPHLRSLNFRRYGRPAASLRLFFDTAACVNRSFDIIHCHFGPNGLRGLALLDIHALRGKLVTSFYGYDVSEFPRRWGRDAYARLFAAGDRFLAVSRVMERELIELGCDPRKILVHRLGVNLQRFSPPRRTPESPIRILTVGRMVPKKGIEYGLRAVAELIRKVPRIEYFIIGDGPLRRDMERLVEDLGLGSVVHLLGWKSRPEIVSALHETDVLLAPSMTSRSGDKEGTPTIILEALACGVPVVSTFHAGIPEVVKDGVTGYLVPERDVQHLSTALERLANSPDLRVAMGERGRSTIKERHDIGKLNDRLVEVYGEITGIEYPRPCLI